jgi:hypothetical protein
MKYPPENTDKATTTIISGTSGASQLMQANKKAEERRITGQTYPHHSLKDSD